MNSLYTQTEPKYCSGRYHAGAPVSRLLSEVLAAANATYSPLDILNKFISKGTDNKVLITKSTEYRIEASLKPTGLPSNRVMRSRKTIFPGVPPKRLTK